MIELDSIRDCFEGVIPSSIATVDGTGVPNVSYLSHVFYVDQTHVAVSNQFFSKTAANVRENGRATLLAVDGRSGHQYSLELAYRYSLDNGELFERMSAHLRAISSQHGVQALMDLRSADVYRVVGCRAVPSPEAAAVPQPGVDRLSLGQRLARSATLSAALAAEPNPDRVLDVLVDGLHDDLNFSNLILLAPFGDRLTTLTSRGYEKLGVGSEVRLGEGAIGIAAERGQPVRISDKSRGRRFEQAVRASSGMEADRHIVLPGLAEPQSELAVPMIAKGRLFGILFAESPDRFAFTREDEALLTMMGCQLAALADEPEGEAPASATTERQEVADSPAFHVRYFAFDDSVFIDGDYIIKGVAGRLLVHLLQQFTATGRCDFTNRELRLDQGLRLPDLKDNLETRLILLRRRLDEREAPVRISKPARGLLRLEVLGAPVLDIMPRQTSQSGA